MAYRRSAAYLVLIRTNPLRFNELALLAHLTPSTLILYIETNGYYQAADRQVVSVT